MPRIPKTDALEARIDDDILLTKKKMPLEIVVDTDDEKRHARAYLAAEGAKNITVSTRSEQPDLWPPVTAGDTAAPAIDEPSTVP